MRDPIKCLAYQVRRDVRQIPYLNRHNQPAIATHVGPWQYAYMDENLQIVVATVADKDPVPEFVVVPHERWEIDCDGDHFASFRRRSR